ncbi:MAG: hypothetical protein IJM56_03985, partial [Clostridia bacterium]|nr:hypothetical protein [Clostridia bacterium]
MDMNNKFGHFAEGGKAFEITTPAIPRNWYNYFFTDNYVSFTSQCAVGQGFLQDSLGRRLQCVGARGMYALEEETGWNLCGLPVYEKNDGYRCTHRRGASEIELSKNGVKSRWTLFVPRENDAFNCCEVSIIEIENLSERAREIKLIFYVENDLDGAYKLQGYNTHAAAKSAAFNGLKHAFREDFEGQKRSFTFFSACDAPLSGWDAARNAFIGPYNSVFDPIALHRGGCSDSDCVAEKMGFALETTLKLEPHGRAACCFVCGIAESDEKVEALIKRFCRYENAKEALSQTVQRIEERLDKGLKLHAPIDGFDELFNYWLKYETDLGSRWARVRHNGYRDIASDTECLATFEPRLAWERIKRLLTYQYA